MGNSMIGGGEAPSVAALEALAVGETMVRIDDLHAGYGDMEILHGLSLRIGAGQSLCLIGPNGAGKSTVLHAIFGFTRIMSGAITIGGQDLTRRAPSDRLRTAKVAYVLQDDSVFPNM